MPALSLSQTSTRQPDNSSSPHKPCGQAKTHTSMPTVHGWLQTQQLAITAHSDGVRGWSPPAHEASSKRTTPRRHTKLRAAAHVHTHVQQRVESGSTSSGNTTPRAPNTGTQITNRRARPPRHKQSNFFRDRIGTTPTQPPRPPSRGVRGCQLHSIIGEARGARQPPTHWRWRAAQPSH